MTSRGSRLPFGKRAVVVHAVLALLTLGLWLLVPAAILTWRRGGTARKVSYGLWAAIGVVVLALGYSLGSTPAPRAEQAAVQTGSTTTVTVTEAAAEEEAVAAAAAPAPKPVTSTRRTKAVAEVYDGDTIKLADGGRVRLVQIDAPELRQGECHATESREVLRALLPPGTRVRIELDPSLDGVDRYGRQLAYVFKGRENVNHTLVLRGAASVWFFEGDRGAHAAKLEAAAQEAAASKRGLWGACSATEYDALHAVATKKPAPPPPPPPPVPPAPSPASACHPSYEGACLDPAASDYDCEGGSGNGPLYTGYVKVVGPDDYGLDRDDDGDACE
jgi:endonuclease YncB( thermonuclease family)